MSADPAIIEAWMLAERRWVPADEICRRFAVNERALRALDDRPGLLTGFAISGDKGFRHIECATDAEWGRFQQRLRAHGIAELVRVRNLRIRRAGIVQKTPPPCERHTGQFLLPV